MDNKDIEVAKFLQLAKEGNLEELKPFAFKLGLQVRDPINGNDVLMLAASRGHAAIGKLHFMRCSSESKISANSV